MMMAALTLLVTATPLNAVDVPIHEQEHRLGVLLRSHGMLTEAGEIIAPAGELTYDDCARIDGSAEYLRSAGGRRSPFGRAAAESDVLRDVYAFAPEADAAAEPQGAARAWVRYRGNAGYDVEGYRVMYPMNTTHLSLGAEAALHWSDPAGREIDVPLTETFGALRERYLTQAAAEEPLFSPTDVEAPLVLPVDAETTVLLTEVSFTYEDGAYTDAVISGFVLQK